MLGLESCCEQEKKEFGFVGLWVWWVFIEESLGFQIRCYVMLCCWFAVGLIEEELVEEKGKEEMVEYCERERQSIGRHTT